MLRTIKLRWQSKFQKTPFTFLGQAIHTKLWVNSWDLQWSSKLSETAAPFTWSLPLAWVRLVPLARGGATGLKEQEDLAAEATVWSCPTLVRPSWNQSSTWSYPRKNNAINLENTILRNNVDEFMNKSCIMKASRFFTKWSKFISNWC